MKIRVGAYCRVSTEKDQENSFESQKKYFTEYINKNAAWELVNIYADDGISGTQTKNRIAFKQMISDAEDKKLDLILTKEISRFARNTVDSIEYTRLLKKLGVGVMFINDNINTLDNDGELRLTIMSGIAQEESRRTSERVKWGQKRRMEQGVVFGRELLGYYLNKGVLSINNEEAEIVKLIFHKYLIEGKGTHVIARELYEENIKPKKTAKRWSNTMILKVLRNEKYVGDLLQKKTITIDHLEHIKKYNKGSEEMVYIKDHHEPIIDRETWDATQLELARRTTSDEQKSKYSNRYWCSGKLICGICGERFIGKRKKLRNGQVYKAWRCHEAANHGTQKIDSLGNRVGCNNSSVNHIALGNIVGFILSTIDKNKEKIIDELTQDIKIVSKQQKIKSTDSFDRKIELLNEKKKKVINLAIEGFISKDDMVLMNKKYDGEIEALNEKIQEIKDINLISRRQADALQIYINRIREIVNGLSDQNMEEIYKNMVKKIIVYENNILDIFLNCLPNPIKIQYSSSGKNGQYEMEYKFID